MQKDAFPILGIDYIEMYVNSADDQAKFFSDVLGFEKFAERIGQSDRATSYALRQKDIVFVVTGKAHAPNVAEYIAAHGEGVVDIAFTVPDAHAAHAAAVGQGAIEIAKPLALKDKHGTVVCAAIGTYGETIHSLIERKNYRGAFLPGYTSIPHKSKRGIGLRAIDHIVGNVERGAMNAWVEYYERIMGFTNTAHFSEEVGALMSKVIENSSGKIKLPINEPDGKVHSHIDKYLELNRGPGVQHIAMQTRDIVKSVALLRKRGMEFVDIPRPYYDEAKKRFTDIASVDIDELQKHGILVDRDEDGYLLQTFTKGETLFFELIERHGCKSFGHNNFRALFEAKEREKAERNAH